tara:strand:+ start:602 stop:973 length:372 start_codon:yes stop_codon:yes gene_type:complete
MNYFLLGVLAPIFLNLLHMVVGIYVVIQRGSITSLGFTGISFITKSIGMIFLTWLGVSYLGMDMKIFVPLLAFFWFFTHVVEAFVIQHYIQQNVPKHLQDLQITGDDIAKALGHMDDEGNYIT